MSSATAGRGQKLDQVLPRPSDLVEQNGELVVGKENHLGGFVPAQFVAIAWVSRYAPVSYCAIQSTGEEAVFVGSGLGAPVRPLSHLATSTLVRAVSGNGPIWLGAMSLTTYCR